MKYDCMIIGGGASGLAAAVALSGAGRSVAVLEKQDRVGRKLLSTGNGRCNLTNMRAEAKNYHGDTECITELFKRFSPQYTLDFFEKAGVPAQIDGEGRAYPMSNTAAAVLDALRLSAAENGAEIITGRGADRLTKKNGLFVSGDVRAERALVCTGGLAAPKLGACGDGYDLLGAFGHAVTAKFPALSPLKTDPDSVRGLKGQRLECRAELVSGGRVLRSEDGEILFSENGVSGIAAMQMARQAGMCISKGKKAELRIKILENSAEYLQKRRISLQKRAAEDFLTGIVPKRVGQTVMRMAGVQNQSSPVSEIGEAEFQKMCALMNGWSIPVTGVCGFDQAQVTAGGVSMADFDGATMESKREKGLFAAGEVLNIDGDCGGYNLQWAWASAFAAAEAMK